MPKPQVSVIIPHHRGLDFIRGCLASLRQSLGVTYEIIVVTSDLDYTKGEEDVALYEPGGPAHKRNVGVQKSQADILVFLDDDTEVSPYTLYEYVHGFQALPQASMLFSRIYNGERRTELDDCGSWLTPTGFLYARASNKRISHDELMRPVPCLASKSAGCAIKREWFYKVGGFDASYYILGEETDLAWRVWLQGGIVYYWPHAVLWHWFNTASKPVQDYYSLERIHKRGASNYISLLASNLGALRLWTILPLHVLAWLMAAAGFAAKGQATRGRLVLAGLWDGLVCRLPSTRRKRQAVQQARCVGDRTLFQAVMRPVPLAYYPQRMAQYVWNGLHG